MGTEGEWSRLQERLHLTPPSLAWKPGKKRHRVLLRAHSVPANVLRVILVVRAMWCVL